jgi:hypothetical protein
MTIERTFIKNKTKPTKNCRVPVAHTYNPSYTGLEARLGK